MLGALAAGLLLLLLALGVLLPPHLQIRGIEPPLPTEADLRTLLGSEDGPIRLEVLPIASQPSGDGALGHNVFLLTWPDGRHFMIDAGMDESEAEEFARLISTISGGGPQTFHADVAQGLGAAIDRVAGVAFTHLHIDHTQGIVPFCAGRTTGPRLFQTAAQAGEQNLHTQEGAEILARSCLEPGALRGAPLQATPDFPGLALVTLGGHTPGSTLIAAAVGERLWLFSGDITNTKRDLIEDRGKGFLYSYLFVPENTDRTAELRGWLRSLDARDDIDVVVAHDIDDARALGIPAFEAP